MPAAVVLAFDVPTDLGKVYLIEYKEALSEVAWKLLCRIVGDGRLNTIIEELKRDVHSKFYRTHPEQMDYATNFRFPVDGDWAVNCNSFWSCCHSCYHLGEDVGRDAGTSVFAPAYGIVRHTRQRTKFGNVIIIEHDTGQEILTTVMGHLRADVQVTVGNTVTNGQLLGFLGDSDQNGGWNPHIHFGIHKGAYSGDNAIDCGSGWVYAGYSANTCVEADWYIPTEFINFHDGD
jgi:murein DD-endopeptidase MepM/ murein hydrolase activator NlpD